MTAEGRIPCINPHCRRTADATKYAPSEEIVCGKCWRALPHGLRDRYRQLRRRDRRLQRRIAQRSARGDIKRSTIEAVHESLELAMRNNWQGIRKYFVTPERPVGLESFLQEVGL